MTLLRLAISCALLLALVGCPTEDDDPFGRLDGSGDDDDDDDGPWPGPYLPLDAEEEAVSAILVGEVAEDSAGFQLVALGDLDGDGVGDFAVGAPDWEAADAAPGFGEYGRVYVFYGGSVGAGLRGSVADADLVIDGTLSGGKFGIFLTSVPDLDGDGNVELLAGRTATNLEAAALLFTSGQLAAGGDLEDEEAHAVLQVSDILENPYVGAGAASPGDLDGDGLPEVVVGAPGLSAPDADGDPMSEAGKAFLFTGADLADGGDFDLFEATTVISGHAERADCGERLFGVGDVDGDGVGDLVIGSRRLGTGEEHDHGRAFFFRGADLLDGDMDLDDAFASWRGAQAGDELGIAAAGLGDLDGDGLDDLAVSAWKADAAGGDHGKVYVLGGAALGTGGDRAISESAGWEIVGSVADQFGRSLAVGDVDGDELLDLLVGAPEAAGVAQAAGKSHLFTGADLLDFGEEAVGSDEASAIFAGAISGEESGTSVAIVPDMDGDRLDEILIGAPEYTDDAVGNWTGRAILVFSAYPDPELE